MLCRVLGVSKSGYYAWCHRPVSKRLQVDKQLTEQIRAFHQRSNGTYGAPRIFQDLREVGVHISRKRVARLMRQANICGVSRRKGILTTYRSITDEKAPDLVHRGVSLSAYRLPSLMHTDDLKPSGLRLKPCRNDNRKSN